MKPIQDQYSRQIARLAKRGAEVGLKAARAAGGSNHAKNWGDLQSSSRIGLVAMTHFIVAEWQRRLDREARGKK